MCILSKDIYNGTSVLQECLCCQSCFRKRNSGSFNQSPRKEMQRSLFLVKLELLLQIFLMDFPKIPKNLFCWISSNNYVGNLRLLKIYKENYFYFTNVSGMYLKPYTVCVDRLIVISQLIN